MRLFNYTVVDHFQLFGLLVKIEFVADFSSSSLAEAVPERLISEERCDSVSERAPVSLFDQESRCAAASTICSGLSRPRTSASTLPLGAVVEYCVWMSIRTCTGPAPRDVTPEATLAIADKEMPGFGEQMRQISLRFVPTAILSRQDGVIRANYSGPLVLNSDYTAESAEADVTSGRADAIAFGRPYISNPDLAKRIRVGAEWAPNVNVPASWYLPGPAGYIDYPTMDEETADAAE